MYIELTSFQWLVDSVAEIKVFLFICGWGNTSSLQLLPNVTCQKWLKTRCCLLIPQHCSNRESTDQQWAHLEKPWRTHVSASSCLFPFCLTKHVRHYFTAAAAATTAAFLLRAAQISTDSLGFHCPYQVPLPAPPITLHRKGVLKGDDINQLLRHRSTSMAFESFPVNKCLILGLRNQAMWSELQDNLWSDTFGAATDILSSLLTSLFSWGLHYHWRIVGASSRST